MAKKFSLKDNPIFQGLKAPESGTSTTSEEEKTPQDPQNLTLKNRPSKTDPQNSLSKSNEQISTSTFQQASATTAKQTTQNSTLNAIPQTSINIDHEIEKQPKTPKSRPSKFDRLNQNPIDNSKSDIQHSLLDLKENFDKSLFFGFYNEVSDVLLPTLEPNAQVLYNRLFRLSYGFNRNYCTVSQPLLMQRTGLSRNTVRTGLQSLVKKGWIRIVESGNRVSTTYRIFLPRERHLKTSYEDPEDPEDPEPHRHRQPFFDPQNLTLKNKSSKISPSEAQNSDLHKITLNEQNLFNHNNNNELFEKPPKFDPQNLTPLLSLTNRSLTQNEGETDPQNLTLNTTVIIANNLIEKFYAHSATRVSKIKREQNLKICIDLLEEGFSADEISYAISWLLEHYPDTGTFNRIAHFIDQALRDQKKSNISSTLSRQDIEKTRKEELEHKHNQEIQNRINRIKESLSEKQLIELEREAITYLEEEYGSVTHGRSLLLRMKVDDLIHQRYMET